MNDTSDKYANFSHDELVAEINRLKKHKKYGLVWEHKTEKVIEDFETQQPYLEEVTDKRIEDAPGEPTNLIIEGDNFEALSILNYTHAGKVDVIYIDPPYNTGNKDFIYNDDYVDSEDEFRHSKWLSFMESRLVIARNILKEDGVIFISIDEHEQANLKCLCDKVYGENNYIDNFIWVKNSTKNLSKTTSTNHEYILCYTKDIEKVSDNESIFRVEKAGLNSVKALLADASKNNLSPAQAERSLKDYYKSNPNLKGIAQYNKVDYGPKYSQSTELKAYRLDNTAAPKSSGKAATYKVIHPIDGRPCKCPVSGWRYTEETMRRHIENGQIEFYQNHNYVPAFKRYLDSVETEVQKSVIVDFIDGKKELMRLFGDSPFDNPKPTTLIRTLLRCFNKNSVILDFFAGSGTTGQATIELNKEDGGHRQFILCTNNGDKGPDSTKIAEEITYPRVKTVITGKRQDGSKYSDGIPANLRYYKINHREKKPSIDANRQDIVAYMENIIQVKENAYKQLEANEDFVVYESKEKYVGLVFEPFSLEEVIANLKERNAEKHPVKLYVFSYSRDAFEDDYGADFEIEFVAMPEGLLKTYAHIVEEQKKEDL